VIYFIIIIFIGGIKMSLDGIVVKSIVHELANKIVDGKIDKVYQPEEDEILISLRNRGQNIRLLLSASSNNPRVYITKSTKSNPTAPPMFCMLLRKHLLGGKILSVTQPSLERIIQIDIQSFDELGILSTKELIIEVMGRHSNIILIDKESQKIVDSVKRVPFSVSSVRQVLPGLIYSLPPAQDKINPLNLNKVDLMSRLDSSDNSQPLFKFLYSNFVGLSPLTAREICYLSNLDDNIPIGSIDDNAKESLYYSFSNFMDNINKNNFNPVIVQNINNTELIAFSSIDIKQFGQLNKICHDWISEVLEEFYLTRDNIDRIKQKSNDLRKLVSNKLERAYSKLSKQREEFHDSEKRDEYRIYGDLITANMYKLQKGQDKISLENFYSENLEEIEIKLNPRLTPNQNAQKYFKKYNKLKNAYELVGEQIVKTKEEVDYLEHLLMSMENCTEVKELEEIKEELVKEGFLKGKSKSNKKNNSAVSSAPNHFMSSDGYDIYVGKNNKQNDYLTLKLSTKDDIWLHTKEIPGSHVIIKSKGKKIPEGTLMEAAILAAYFSKGKMSSNVPVDYTERKNVRKPSGAKPGMVIYDNNNTIYITPSIEEINKIRKVES